VHKKDVAHDVPTYYKHLCRMLHEYDKNVPEKITCSFMFCYNQIGICCICCWFLLYACVKKGTTLLLHVCMFFQIHTNL
jgi:hypothetical protein